MGLDKRKLNRRKPGHCSCCGGPLPDAKRRCCPDCRRRSAEFARAAINRLRQIRRPWPKRLAHEVNALPARL